MAFVPTINFCLEKNSTTLEYELAITDTTDAYDSTGNTTGWEDASTLLRANVVTATLTITDSIGAETTIDVLSQIPNPVTGEVSFTNLTSDSISIQDGYYKVLYTITDATNTYTACEQRYFYPDVACCISNIVNMLAEDPTNEEIYEDLIKVKALEKALQAAAASVDKTTADNLLTLLKKYCDYKSNYCNC